jgi:hypothetical protein
MSTFDYIHLKQPYKFNLSHMKNLQIKRNYYVWLILAMIISLFILPERVNAQKAKTNFSGIWAFNESKSNMGEGRGFRSARQITVAQDGNNLTVERVRTNQNGESTTTSEKYTLDGKESVNTSGRGPSKAIVKWTADGKSLNFAITRSFERDGQTTEIKSSEVWTLPDAKTLSIQSTTVMQDNERKATIVYDKK